MGCDIVESRLQRIVGALVRLIHEFVASKIELWCLDINGGAVWSSRDVKPTSNKQTACIATWLISS
jgi:hypothetical protein